MSLLRDRSLQFLDLSARYEVRRGEVFVCMLLGLALAGVLLYRSNTATALAGGYLLISMLIIMVVDYRQFIVPDILSLPAIPFGMAAAVVVFPGSAGDALAEHGIAAIVAASVLLLIRILYRHIRKIEGLGLGDVKLAAAAGAWIGLDYLAMTCLLASMAALTAILVRRVINGSDTIDLTTAVPFGSFIAPAIVIMWLFRLFLS